MSFVVVCGSLIWTNCTGVALYVRFFWNDVFGGCNVRKLCKQHENLSK